MRKFIFATSLLANLVFFLFQCRSFLHSREQRQLPNTSPVRIENIAPILPAVATTRESGPSVVRANFQWSDLVSSDDTTYASNLRTVGCPEDTIRDILTAAIAHRYDQKREEIALQHQRGLINSTAMQDAVAQSWQQQNDAVAALPSIARNDTLAQPVNAVQAAATLGNALPGAGSLQTTGPSRDPNIRMPIAMAEPDQSLGLNDAQKAAAYQVGDNFAKTVNAQNLAPTDPAYHQIWQKAQDDADERLKVQIGWQAFQQWQIQHIWQK